MGKKANGIFVMALATFFTIFLIIVPSLPTFGAALNETDMYYHALICGGVVGFLWAIGIKWWLEKED